MEADREFRQFSELLRLQTANFSNLSLGDSIWADPFLPTNKSFSINKTIDERRNFESVAATAASALGEFSDFKPSDWKVGFGGGQKLAFANSKIDRYNNSSKIDRYNNSNLNLNSAGAAKTANYFNSYNNNNGEIKNYFDKAVGKPVNSGYGDKKKNNYSSGKDRVNKKISNNNNNGSGSSASNSNGVVDKRFKTLPPEEALPRNETIGGYIFVCNNDTMEENLWRQLFGLPQRYRDSVRAITPGLPLFLYNYSTHQLHGIFEAASFGGTNIDRTAWEDKKKLGESRFPAQVRVVTRKYCEPLEEDSFRPILHHYDGPKFRLELSVPEALDVLDKFAEQNA